MSWRHNQRNQEPLIFQFDTKTGDMILRFGEGDNTTEFDNFRSKLVGGDLDLQELPGKPANPYNEYGRLEDHDPENQFQLYRGYHGRRSQGEPKDMHFSISMRANTKRKFKFYDQWTATGTRLFMTEKGGVKTFHKDQQYNLNGRWIDYNDPDFPESEEDFTVHKETKRDDRWGDKVLRDGYIYF